MDFRDNSKWTAKTLATKELVKKEPPGGNQQSPTPTVPPQSIDDLNVVAAELAATVADNTKTFDASLLRAAFQAAGGAAGFVAWARANPDNVYKLSLAVARDRVRVDHQATKPSQLIAVQIHCGIPGREPAVIHAPQDVVSQITMPQLTGNENQPDC